MTVNEQAAGTDWKPSRVHLFIPDRERAQRIGERVRRMLETAGLTQVDEPESPDDLVLTLGGDGTFLSALRSWRAIDPVFCGINAGRLGFLHEVDEENLIPALDRLLKGQYAIETHQLMEVVRRSEKGGETAEALVAFNEVVVERRGTRALRMTLRIDGHELTPMVGDGLLVSTAGGSTGYALAAGGAVVHPACQVIQVLPLHPHRSRIARSVDNPLIAPMDTVLEIEVTQDEVRQPRLVVDGEEAQLEDGDVLTIRRSDQSVRILRLGLSSFWERLRDKFF